VRPVHLNLDDAWPQLDGFVTLDLRHWGPKLRYHGKRREVDQFYDEIRDRLTPFVLYGSGDFHYLAAVLLRRVTEPVTVVSFDNHPDWDIRPPYWSCGGWINRALELPCVKRVCVWGCGNFELQFPSRLFANRGALRSKKLEVHGWAERQPPAVCRRFDCMTRENWMERFDRFANGLAGQNLYVTVDLDCLREEEAATNWENGLFTSQDVAWALSRFHAQASLIGGDLCGAYSPPKYARTFQQFAGNWDHPKIRSDERPGRSDTNLSLKKIWPTLSGVHRCEGF
jgi:arginase family enzyme